MWVIKRALGLAYWVLVLVAVLLATIVVASKFLLPMVDNYRPQIERNLSQLSGMPVHVENISAKLNGINIMLAAAKIDVDTPQQKAALSVEDLEFELDLPRTLLTLSPQFKNFVVSGVDVALYEDGNGKVSLAGLEVSPQSSNNTDVAVSRVLNYVTEQQQISVHDVQLSLASSRFDALRITLPDSYLVKQRSKTLLSSDVYVNDQHAPIKVRVEVESDITSFLKKYANIYIQVPELSMPTEWLQLSFLENTNYLDISGEFWATYRPGSGFEVQSQGSQFGVSFTDQSRVDLGADWRLKTNGNTSAITVSRLEWLDNNKAFKSTQLKGEWDLEAKRGFVAYDYLDAQTVSQLALQFVPEEWYLSRLLNGLNAQGSAQNGMVRVWSANEAMRYQVGTNLYDAKVEGYNGIPAVDNVSGVFSLTDSGGGVEFLAVDSQLAFPTLYDSPWSIDKASGEVAWRKVQDTFVVSGEGLQVDYKGADLRGEFRLEQPEEGDGWLALDVNGRNLDVSDKFTFVPPNALSESLVDWLDTSLNGGKAHNVDVLVRAGLSPGQKPLVRLNVDAQVDELQFSPDWPAAKKVSANVYLGQSEVDVQVDKASLADLPISDLSINVPLTSNGASWLNIAGSLQNDANLVLNSLSQTPLKEQVLSPFAEWELEGDVDGAFRVYLPLSAELGNPVVDLLLNFSPGNLYIPDINLAGSLESGLLHFNSRTGLKDSVFRVNTLGGNSEIVLTSEQPDDGRFVVNGQVKGQVASGELAGWRSLPEPIARRLTGKTDYEAEFHINRSQSGQVDVKVLTDLKSVSADLPKPFNKTAQVALPFELDLKIYKGEILLNFDAEQLLYGKLLLESGDIKSGHFSLFKPLPEESTLQQGVAFNGQVERFEWQEWTPLIEEIVQGKTQVSAQEQSQGTPISLEVPEWIRSLDLLMDEVPINDANQLNNVKLVYSRYQEGSPLTLTSDELNLVLRDAATTPSLHIAYANWRTGEKKDQPEETESSFLTPSMIPTINLRLDQLVIDNRPYGDWRANVVNLGENVRIDNISTGLNDGEFKGNVFWQGGEKPNVEMVIDASGSDTRELTRKFSPTPFIQSNSYDLDVVLSWSGSILEFDRESLNGRIKFLVEDGTFNQVDQLPAFVRVLGIFNVDSLLKRLTFDFSDLYEEGMPFDDFSSSLVIQDGMLNTDEPVRVISPTAEVRLTGSANLVDETLDERLTATIPISSTLPVAGLLLATPQIAGLLYITDKLIGDKISQVTSIQYEIKGPFANPEVIPVKYNPRR